MRKWVDIWAIPDTHFDGKVWIVQENSEHNFRVIYALDGKPFVPFNAKTYGSLGGAQKQARKNAE